MPFMVAYWITVVLLFVPAFVEWVNDGAYFESNRSGRIWRRFVKVAAFSGIALVLLGLWVPVFVPVYG